MKRLWHRFRLATWLLLASQIRLPWLVFKHRRRSRKPLTRSLRPKGPPDRLPALCSPTHPDPSDIARRPT